MSRTAVIITLGCRLNHADTALLSARLKNSGYELRDDFAVEPDLILLNSCAITAEAERKSRQQIRKLRREYPKAQIVVAGCAAEVNSAQFKECGADLVLTNPDKKLFPGTPAGKKSLEEKAGNFCEKSFSFFPFRSRAFIKIQEGCDNFCSYCIVPYVRGRERSRKKEDIVAEVKALVAEGYKDITLLGQNVNSYGKGTDTDFADLLAELDAIEGDFWLRFMTSHPKDASHKLIDVMAGGKHIAHQFHLPLQSGNDTVLKAMNRHYDMARYMDSVHYMRKLMPDVTVTSDIIVGFPGETEAQFEDTLKALRDVRFDMLYSFIYSPRKGTPAAEKEQVPDTVKGNRFDRLLATQNEIALSKNEPLVGKTLKVLCDGVSKGDDSVYSGRTEGNKIVFFKGTPDMVGRFVNVEINKAEAFALWGETEKT